MFRSVVCAMFVMTVTIGLVAAEEFSVSITKVDGDKVSFFKTKKGQREGDEMTLPVVAKDLKVNAAKKDGKKIVAGDPIEGGLKASVFQKIGEKGVAGRVVTSDDNKSITQIIVFQKK